MLLDPHNYARYYGDVVGGPKVGADVFADLWAKLVGGVQKQPARLVRSGQRTL